MNNIYRLDNLKDLAYEIATEKSTVTSSGYRWDVNVRLEAMRTYAMLVEAENGKRSNKAQ